MDPLLDIIIIGAGPTGLLSGVLASKLNLSAAIIEKRDGPLVVGRADALNARTQQTLEAVKILDDLLPLGLKCNTSSTFKEGNFASRDNRWWVGLKNTHYKEFLMIGQPEVEKAFLGHVGAGVTTFYGKSVSSLAEGPDGVVVECADGSKLRSKYVIAADGAHSVTRKLLNIGFHGVKPNMKWAVLDTFLNTNFPTCPEIISFELNGQARVAWIPRERGMARFYVLLDGGEITQERAEESIRQHMAPYTVEFLRTEWFSQFDVQERLADTFISSGGRIIFAGDSAHVHSVNGGQGLNTGIADAFALIWRLGLVIKREANVDEDRKEKQKIVLESYNKERRDTAQTVINVAANLVRSTLKTAKEYVEIIEKSAANITGMGIKYDNNSPLISEGTSGDFTSGAVCPDFTLSSPSASIRFYQHFEYGKFVVLTPRHTKIGNDEVAKVWNFEKTEGSDTYTITTDANETFTTTFPLGQDQDIVVRPDLYVGYVGTNATEYFNKFLY